MFRLQVLERSGPAITVSFRSNLLFSYYFHTYIYILYEIYRTQILFFLIFFQYKEKRFFVEKIKKVYISICF